MESTSDPTDLVFSMPGVQIVVSPDLWSHHTTVMIFGMPIHSVYMDRDGCDFEISFYMPHCKMFTNNVYYGWIGLTDLVALVEEIALLRKALAAIDRWESVVARYTNPCKICLGIDKAVDWSCPWCGKIIKWKEDR